MKVAAWIVAGVLIVAILFAYAKRRRRRAPVARKEPIATKVPIHAVPPESIIAAADSAPYLPLPVTVQLPAPTYRIGSDA